MNIFDGDLAGMGAERRARREIVKHECVYCAPRTYSRNVLNKCTRTKVEREKKEKIDKTKTR